MILEKVKAIDPDKKLPADIGGTGADLESVLALVRTITTIALDVAIIVGVFMIIYSGFLYVTTFGDESKAETAKKTLLWSIFGTIFIAIAKIIVEFIKKRLQGES